MGHSTFSLPSFRSDWTIHVEQVSMLLNIFPSSLMTRPNKLQGSSSETLSSQVLEFEGKARANPNGVPLDASFLGKLPVLPANIRLDWKVIARYKHSSLFGLQYNDIQQNNKWNVTLSILTFSIMALNAESCCAVSFVLSVIMLNVVMLSVVSPVLSSLANIRLTCLLGLVRSKCSSLSAYQ